MAKTQVSVIICSFNTRDLTERCLACLKKNKNVEVIVVENGTDGTAEMIRKKFPGVKLIEPGENTGFAKGNNLGLRAANPESQYLLLLNTDVFVAGDTIRKAVDYFIGHPECDVLGCRLNLADGKLQPSAGALPTPGNVITWMLGVGRQVHPSNREYFSRISQVGWVMGAFMMMRKQVYDKTGGLDENFFMYMEEVEWCKRMNTAGFKIWYVPAFGVTHLDKGSSGGDLKGPLLKEKIGLIYYLKKYYPSYLWWLIPVIKIGMVMRKMAFRCLGDKNKSAIYADILNSI
jgi:hypothetical protein